MLFVVGWAIFTVALVALVLQTWNAVQWVNEGKKDPEYLRLVHGWGELSQRCSRLALMAFLLELIFTILEVI